MTTLDRSLPAGGTAAPGTAGGGTDAGRVALQQLNAAMARQKREIFDLNLFAIQAEGGSI